MKRRKLLLGVGSATVGSTLITSSGAFSSITADRSMSVSVANDADALLRIAPCEGSPNGDYVTNADSGVMTLDLSPSNGNVGGEGVNPDATTVFNDVFEISNQGTQPVGVWIDVSSIKNGNDEDAISFYRGSDQSDSFDGIDDAVCLDVGEHVCVGFVTRTHGLEPGTNLVEPVSGDDEMVVHADAGTGCATPVGGGTVSVPGPSSGLAGYWPLDSVNDGVVDDFVGGKDGTPYSVADVAGQVDRAGSFDGTSYVAVPGFPDLTSSVSISAWVRTTDPSKRGQRVFADDESNSSGYALSIGDGGAGAVRFYSRGKDDISLDTSTGAIQADTWHHVTGVYDADAETRRIYVDGTEENTNTTDTGLWGTDPGAASIGGETDSGESQYRFLGRLDDVRVYDRALSSTEVTQLYDSTR